MSKKIKIITVALTLLFLFSGCQSQEEEANVIDTYLIGTESVPAMEAAEGVEATETEPSAYAYIGLENAGGAVEEYVNLMTSEENGFSIVNKSYTPAIKEPDFTQEKSVVYLAKESADEENKLLVLQIDWSPNICTVVTSVQDKPEGQGVNGAGGEEEQGLSHTGAVEKVQSMSPSVFELDGSSMDEYNIYIQNGLIMVNGEACIWVEVYTSDTPAQTNIPLGTYYLSRDGERLYILNRDDNTVRQLKMG